MKQIVIWHNPNRNTYYYKIIKGSYKTYDVGFVNQYNHEVIMVINITDICSSCYWNKRRFLFFHKVLRKFISFLQKIDKKL